MQDSTRPSKDSDDTLVEPTEKAPQEANADAVAGGLIGAAIGNTYLGNFPGAPMNIGIAGLSGGESGVPHEHARQDDESFWRENHPSQPFAIGKSYETYECAYRAGYDSYARHHGRDFSEVESQIQAEYEKSELLLPWEQARPAAKAAWDRAHQLNHRKDYLS